MKGNDIAAYDKPIFYFVVFLCFAFGEKTRQNIVLVTIETDCLPRSS